MNKNTFFYYVLTFCRRWKSRSLNKWFSMTLILTNHPLFMFPNCFMYKSHLIVHHCSALWPPPLQLLWAKFDFLTTPLSFLRCKFSFSAGDEYMRRYVLAYQTYFTLPKLKCKPGEEKKLSVPEKPVDWRNHDVFQVCN